MSSLPCNLGAAQRLVWSSHEFCKWWFIRYAKDLKKQGLLRNMNCSDSWWTISTLKQMYMAMRDQWNMTCDLWLVTYEGNQMELVNFCSQRCDFDLIESLDQIHLSLKIVFHTTKITCENHQESSKCTSSVSCWKCDSSSRIGSRSAFSPANLRSFGWLDMGLDYQSLGTDADSPFVPGSKLPWFPYNRGWSSTQ